MPEYRYLGKTTKAFKHAGVRYQVSPGDTVTIDPPIDSPELELADGEPVVDMVELDDEVLTVESPTYEEEE